MPIGNSDRTSRDVPGINVQNNSVGSDPVNQFAAASKRVFAPVLAIVN